MALEPSLRLSSVFFFFNDTATTEIYTLSLHDALPIWLVGGDANAVAAGKRPLSSMTPTMVLKGGKPVLVTGSPGGARIITTVLQTVVNTIDFGMNPAEAAATPRFHHQWTPDELRVEKGISPDTVALLKSRGHNVAVKASMGRTQTIELRDGMLYGASDPRKDRKSTRLNSSHLVISYAVFCLK